MSSFCLSPGASDFRPVPQALGSLRPSQVTLDHAVVLIIKYSPRGFTPKGDTLNQATLVSATMTPIYHVKLPQARGPGRLSSLGSVLQGPNWGFGWTASPLEPRRRLCIQAYRGCSPFVGRPFLTGCPPRLVSASGVPQLLLLSCVRPPPQPAVEPRAPLRPRVSLTPFQRGLLCFGL